MGRASPGILIAVFIEVALTLAFLCVGSGRSSARTAGSVNEKQRR